MSIMPKYMPDDSGYCFDVYEVFVRLGAWLTDPSQDDDGLHALYRLLQDMAAETPFMPAWKTNLPRPRVTREAEFEYRRPVWDAIALEIDRVHVDPALVSQKAKADWLASQLELCHKLRQYEAIVADFQAKLEGIKLTLKFRSSEWVDPDVVLTGSFKERAEAAQQTVLSIVDALIPVLSAMIKKKSV